MRRAEIFESFHSEIEAELKASLNLRHLSLYDMHRYHLGWVNVDGRSVTRSGGKLLRSILCLASCKAAGGNHSQAVPAAVAVELAHNFTLIHDDIEDESEYRRHRPTVWKVWGAAQAINTGDSMYALAYLAVLRLGLRGVPDGKIMYATRVLAHTCLLLCEGQHLDLSYEKLSEITLQDYLVMVTRKTGELLGAAAQLGALVGTDDDEMIERLYRFGKELGVAFQIQDDILGIWGEEERTGKPRYEDILNRKKTLPVICGWQKSAGEDREMLSSLYGRQTMSARDAEQVEGILHRTGAWDYAQSMVKHHYGRAIRELQASGIEASGQQDLIRLADLILGKQD